jgi:hypothetical protein
MSIATHWQYPAAARGAHARGPSRRLRRSAPRPRPHGCRVLQGACPTRSR